MSDKSDDGTPEEAARIREEAIRRTRKPPPKAPRDFVGKSAPPPRREPKGSNRRGR